MAKRGRKPKKRLNGASIEGFDPPNILDGEAQEEWRFVVDELSSQGLLWKVDKAALAGYCEAWSEFRHLTRLVQDQGPTADGVHGSTKANPMINLKNQASIRMLKFASQLGFTPNSRRKIEGLRSAPTAKKNELEEFLNQ